MKNKDEVEYLKALLRSVLKAIDTVLTRFDDTDKHNDVLLPLCNIGMEIDEFLCDGMPGNTEIKPGTNKPTICHKHG